MYLQKKKNFKGCVKNAPCGLIDGCSQICGPQAALGPMAANDGVVRARSNRHLPD